MRILAQKTDRPLGQVLLLLTREEAEELKMRWQPSWRSQELRMTHVNDLETGDEVTVAVYDHSGTSDFAPRVLDLIRTGK